MKQTYKLCVCGHFAFGQNKLNGQTIKTKILTEALEKNLGESEVMTYDTCGGVRNVFTLPVQLFKASRKSRNLIILPAYKGLRLSAFILTLLRMVGLRCKVHYVVIGAWLPSFLKQNPFLRFCVSKGIDTIYVETSTMMCALRAQGINNVLLMPNFKPLEIVSPVLLSRSEEGQLKLCMFSRVMRQKGFGEAVQAVKHVNERLHRNVFTLDIYGPVEKGEEAWFDELKKQFTEDIHYAGTVPYNESTQVLKNYFALLFPTLFYTEGVPGTIIDAYAAGLPVIASRWESYADVIEEGVTGLGYEFGNTWALEELLLEVGQRPEMINQLRMNCIKRASAFSPTSVLEILIKQLL